MAKKQQLPETQMTQLQQQKKGQSEKQPQQQKQKKQSENETVKWNDVSFKVILFSLTSVPVCYGLSYIQELNENHLLVFATGIAAFVVIALFSYLFIFRNLPSKVKRDPYLYIFTIFSWTCVVDLQLALNIDGYLDNLQFYLQEGEKYLLSPHGSLINYWDASVHYVLYIVMINALANGQIDRSASLYWFGSIINSLIVFMPGNVIGTYGSEIRASYLLNIPFCLVPIYYLVSRVLRGSSSGQARRVFQNFVIDTGLILCLILCISVTFLRTLAITGSPLSLAQQWLSEEPLLLDPMAYPKLQVLTHFFYFIPFFSFALMTFVRKTDVSLTLTLAILFSGAAGQGQFSYLGSSIHHLTPGHLQIKSLSIFLVNVILFIVPHAYWLRCRYLVKSKRE